MVRWEWGWRGRMLSTEVVGAVVCVGRREEDKFIYKRQISLHKEGRVHSTKDEIP